MKFRLTLLLSIISMAISSCYDDSAIWDSIKDHESRITKLEVLCNQMNTNIASIQDILKSLENKDQASNISPIMENEKVIGYTIAFSNGKSVTIYLTGEDSSNTVMPSIGVKMDTDGVYYWTLDGEWMTGDDNQKIPAVGKDGNTPKLKIEDGCWWVSYDNGKTWAKVENGLITTSGGSCLFKDVKYDESYIYLTCNDGTVLTIARETLFGVTLHLDEVVWTPGLTSKVKYTLTGTVGQSEIFTISENNWITEVVQTSDTEGYVDVTLPEKDYTKGRFTMWVSNNGKSSVKRVTYTDASSSLIEVNVSNYTISYLGGDMQIYFCSGVETELIIPAEAKDWLSISETRAQHCYTKTLHFEKNLSVERSAVITIRNKYSEYEFKVIQTAISGINIQVSKWLINADGVDYAEIKVVTNEGEDVTEYSSIFDAQDQQVYFPDGKFKTNVEGVYIYKAVYLTHSTEPCVLYALNDIVPLPISDNQPDNTTFNHRSFLLRYTGTLCHYCVAMMEQIKYLEEENIIPDDAVLAVAHTFNTDDPAYISSKFLKRDTYPYLTINNNLGYFYMEGYDLLKNRIEQETCESAAAGIAVNAAVQGDYLIVNVGVKAAKEGDYGVTVWILQDNIYGQQSGASQNWHNYHNDCIRDVLPNDVDPFVGAYLGKVTAGEVKERMLTTMAPTDKLEDYHMVVTVTRKEGKSWYICNAIDCPITGLTNFDYK